MSHYRHKEAKQGVVFSDSHLKTMWVRNRHNFHDKEFSEFLKDYETVTDREKEIGKSEDGKPIMVTEWKTQAEWAEVDKGY